MSSNTVSSQRRATRVAFFSLGFAMASWAPLIPYVKAKLGLDHAGLGLLILCIGVGSIASMLLTGRIIQRVGCRSVVAFALGIFILTLPLIATIDHTLVMGAILTCFGVASGSIGVAINLQAVIIEEKSGTTLMSNFHGMCSLGGLIAALSMTGWFQLGLSPLISTLIASTALIVMSTFAVLGSLSVENTQPPAHEVPQVDTKKRKFAFPHPIILMLGMMCFVAFLTEGAALDWSAVYLTTTYNVPVSNAGLAYGCFAIAMTLSRFLGHHFIRILGEKRLIWASAICASFGMSIVVFSPVWYLVLVGYALVGLGSSNIVPILFSRVGRQEFTPKAQALSYVSILAYSGALCGSALVGFIGQKTGLTFVFGLISVLLLSIAIFNSYTIVRKRRKNRKLQKLPPQK